MSPNNPDHEARLAELETRLAFQDRTIEELHQALCNQQVQLDRLAQEVTRLKSLAGDSSGDNHG